nr:molybdenum cofactor guanylyltransferase [Desulfobulbaceae bacterium]
MTTKLFSCVLIGGKSSRMGQPKQLILQQGKSWFEIIYSQLSPVCKNIIAAGAGDLPPGSWSRVADKKNCRGPLSGIISAMESQPQANCIVCSCDLPFITTDAVRWLVEQSDPSTWAVIPSLGEGFLEPLFAYYDFRILPFLKDLAENKNYRLSDISVHEKARIVQPPTHLRLAWKNCNTLGDLSV